MSERTGLKKRAREPEAESEIQEAPKMPRNACYRSLDMTTLSSFQASQRQRSDSVTEELTRRTRALVAYAKVISDCSPKTQARLLFTSLMFPPEAALPARPTFSNLGSSSPVCFSGSPVAV